MTWSAVERIMRKYEYCLRAFLFQKTHMFYLNSLNSLALWFLGSILTTLQGVRRRDLRNPETVLATKLLLVFTNSALPVMVNKSFARQGASL